MSTRCRAVGRVAVVTFVAALALSPLDLIRAQGQTARRIPRIETHAPGAFDGERPVLSEAEARYQVNATVVIPLIVASVPLVSRDDVGFGSAAGRDFSDGRGRVVRTYEFFAASIPERARGLNRLGFLREAVQLGRDGARWTAHFGVISANRETSREEAEASLDRDESVQPYTILDGLTDRSKNSNQVVELDLEGRWPTADALYADIRPQWQAAEPEDATVLENRDGRTYVQPVGFLGGLQYSLRVVAADVFRGNRPRKFRYPFVHDGKVFSLGLIRHAVDRGRQTRYAEAGLVTPDAVVHRLDYDIVDSDGNTVQPFELWTELPDSFGPLSRPIVPLAFEFMARAFLELRAVRIPPAE